MTSARPSRSVLKRLYLPIGPPDALLDVILGEVAQVITKGQKVLPEKALSLGYKFKHPEILEALRAVFAPLPKVATPPRQPAQHAAKAGHGHH